MAIASLSTVWPDRLHPRWREAIQFLALVAVYVTAAKIGLRAAFVAEQVSPVWPPSGLALWALLYFGVRRWPAIWAGAMVANATTNVPLVAAGVMATGNTLEAVIAVWLLRRFTDLDYVLERLRHVTALIALGALVSTMAGATIGVTTLCAAGLQPWARFTQLWWIWWLGDATGDLLMAPVLLTAAVWHRREYRARLGEAALLVGVTLVLSAFIFVGGWLPVPERHPLEFAIFPLVIWAGLRFAHPGVAIVSLLVSLVAVWGTLRGTGPFNVSSSPQESILLLQIYTAAVAVSGLVLGGAIADRNRSERLRQADHILAAILAEGRELKEIAPRILHAVCDTFDWDVGILWQTDDEHELLVYVDSWQRDGRSDEFIEKSRTWRYPRGVGLPGRVWLSTQPAWIYDVVFDGNFPRAPFAARAGLHGGFAFPIVLGNHVLGIMEFLAHQPRRVDASLLALMAAAGSQIGQFIDRAHAQRRIVASEALNSAIVNAALDCVISIDENGRVVEFNPAAAQTFGVSREQALGQDLAQLIVPGHLRERHRVAMRRCVETGEARILGTRIEMSALRRDGTEFPVELAITRAGTPERQVFTAYIRDISDRRRLEEERTELLARERHARMEAEQANRTKDQFLATVSHELRTPLTAILGWASILQNGQHDPARARQIHDSVFRNAQAQARIVNDLLDVSRVVMGQLRLEPQPLDLCEMVRLSIESIRPTAMAKRVVLETDIPASECFVSGDPARLQQVMWNLLSNAVKFTPSGGTVSLAVRESVSTVTIEVTDTGRGISAADLPHVFERFWQADGTSTRVHGGLGLGLALVRHLVELHGGDVTATSAGENCGSTFTVTFPSAPRTGWSHTQTAAQMTGDALRGLTLLAVDDDAGARELFTVVLESQAARVLCAGSAEEGFGLFQRAQPDAMMIDLGMPGEDGFTLLKRIRTHEKTTGWTPTRAIAVTAYTGEAVRRDVLQAGFDAYLSKPVLPHDMVSAVLQALQR
jgi:PAS domain S-box-containing protein